jgi:hypothetical protein
MSCVARRRHPDKDIEGALVEAEAHGWAVVPGASYWKLRCGCPVKHQRMGAPDALERQLREEPGKLVEASVMLVTMEAS